MSPEIRVMVVDDDRAARGLHCRTVSETPGFTVAATAGSGEEALAHDLGGIDLVLLDMRLPGISGIEVLHRLRTLGAGGPDVVVISSSQDQTTVRQALAARIVGYLVKPFTQAVLQERLRAYRDGRRERADEARQRALSQGEIDRLLMTGGIRTVPRSQGASMVSGDSATARHPQGAARLPKGLAEPTLARVVAALDPVRPTSAAEVADDCAISRATAHRYLSHLVDVGVIDLAHRYGKRGRPQVLYRLASAPE